MSGRLGKRRGHNCPIKTSSEYSVLYAVKKRHDETSKVSEYDIIVECAASVSQAIKVLVKDARWAGKEKEKLKSVLLWK